MLTSYLVWRKYLWNTLSYHSLISTTKGEVESIRVGCLMVLGPKYQSWFPKMLLTEVGTLGSHTQMIGRQQRAPWSPTSSPLHSSQFRQRDHSNPSVDSTSKLFYPVQAHEYPFLLQPYWPAHNSGWKAPTLSPPLALCSLSFQSDSPGLS